MEGTIFGSLRTAVRARTSQQTFVMPSAHHHLRSFTSCRSNLAKVTAPITISQSPKLRKHDDRSSSNHESSSSSSAMSLDENKIQDHRTLMQLKRERKLKEYEAKMKIKAMQEGISLEEFKQKSIAKNKLKAIQPFNSAAPAPSASGSVSASLATSSTPKATTTSSKILSAVEKRDLEIATQIQERARSEAARKLASGHHLNPSPSSGSQGSDNGPIKPLSKILDIEKLRSQDIETITKLWTGYHVIKNKLSAVIPRNVYEEMVKNAKKFPQFVLPLPRKVIDGEVAEENTEDGAAAGNKEAFEMQFLEWAILPPSPSRTSSTTAMDGALPPAATTLFTPLAEYKLKQDFSQPVLILTYYPDLATSHDVVLMRGEITNLNEETGKGGRINQKEAQLLSLTLQRFYLPTNTKDKEHDGNGNGKTCNQLLVDFHTNPEKFNVEDLVNLAFKL